MPDVSRSDSQRSTDSSSHLRPRVSFNRDVHVKRIELDPDRSYYTVPRNVKKRKQEQQAVPPRKPPRTFAYTPNARTTLRRSVSDATPVQRYKHQLSPIIEVKTRDDYFQKPIPQQTHLYGIDSFDTSDYYRKVPPSIDTMYAHQPTYSSRMNPVVLRSNNDHRSPTSPNKDPPLVSPSRVKQHNSNLPFSYTSPESVIYSQVRRDRRSIAVPPSHTNGLMTDTNGKSDSDEGLGCDDFRTCRPEPDEDPIRPKFQAPRGRTDGMVDAVRRLRDSDIRPIRHADISARRDMLESRINNRIHSPHYRDVYKSTPDIYRTSADTSPDLDPYHEPLRRLETPTTSHHKVYEYVISNSKYTKYDKLGDSGIENDIRRDDGIDLYRPTTNGLDNAITVDASDDEGFASSVMIANKLEYVGRERSIDDGAYFDPRLDKFHHKLDTKPPKPEKKSGLEKVKQLFSRDSSKGRNKVNGVASPSQGVMVGEETLRARYKEYKGSTDHLDSTTLRRKKDYSGRLSTTPSSNPPQKVAVKPSPPTNNLHGSWFKSLDRLARKKTKQAPAELHTSTEEETSPRKQSPATNRPKNLRFFGDTDPEMSDSSQHKHALRRKCQSTRDLHYSSPTNEPVPLRSSRSSYYQYAAPAPNTRSPNSWGNNGGESSTEGEGSQRSVVYLHAPTVGDIPRSRAQSREDLRSPRMQQSRTVSRSMSVLAPWRPHHVYDRHIDYSNTQPQQHRYAKNAVSRPSKKRSDFGSSNNSTLKRSSERSQSGGRSGTQQFSSSNSAATNMGLRRSRDNITTMSDTDHGTSHTMYRKKERLPRENDRYSGHRENATAGVERRIPIKFQSTESLHNTEHNRSCTMPKAGTKRDTTGHWFRRK